MGHHSDEFRHRDEAIARALADKGRPARDRARDRRDHIGKVLAFASIAPGEIVADFLPFRGYYTRLFASLVGPAGRAYAVVPEDLTCVDRIAKGHAEIAGFAASKPAIEMASGAVARAGALPSLSISSGSPRITMTCTMRSWGLSTSAPSTQPCSRRSSRADG